MAIVPNVDFPNAQTELLQEFQTAVRSLFDAAVTHATTKKNAAKAQAHVALQ
jgi:hypothetical protein